MTEPACPKCARPVPEGGAFCPGCGHRLDGRAEPADSAKPPQADLAGPLAEALGPGYQVRGLSGRGGFADVYEAFDPGLNRRLAIKVLRPDVAWTPGMLARFKDECRILASLSHPNIPPIYFLGEGRGLFYYAMPYVEGQTLGDTLRTFGALEVDRALDLAVPVLEALQHAHDAGLLHRDIKPDNVLIDAATGRALLVDFGIAKRLDASAGMTQTGFVVGTPTYMSPEQALGQGQLDGRSDLYAFGAMLFQMVTGSPPYDGDSSQEIVAKHIADPVPAPSDRNARIPAWLSDVIVRCLAKRPGDRFQSAATLADALRVGRSRPPGPTVSAEQVATRVSASHQSAAPEPAPPTSPFAAEPARPRYRVGLIFGLGIVAVGLVIGWILFGRPVVVTLTNGLTEPVLVVTPRGDSLEIPARGSLPVELPSSGFARLIWAARPRLGPDGRSLGDPPSGELNLRAGRGRSERTIGLADTRVPMFEPLVTNAGSVPLRIVVNHGLAGARDCGCLVPVGATRLSVGYYPLFRNSTVRAIRPDGKTATFLDLGPQVDPAAGRVGLRFEDVNFR